MLSLRRALYDRGLAAIRESWEEGEKPALVLSALRDWLSLVGEVYGSNAGEPGWDWFLRDYCDAYSEESLRADLRRELRRALVSGTTLNVGAVLRAVDNGFMRLLEDAESQELVRRSILPTWRTMESEFNR